MCHNIIRIFPLSFGTCCHISYFCNLQLTSYKFKLVFFTSNSKVSISSKLSVPRYAFFRFNFRGRYASSQTYKTNNFVSTKQGHVIYSYESNNIYGCGTMTTTKSVIDIFLKHSYLLLSQKSYYSFFSA